MFPLDFHSLFNTVFQQLLQTYPKILAQSALTTLSNTVHSEYYSRPAITAKLFQKNQSYNIH